MTYHFVGVGGIGMSAIARILRARNVAITGSDVNVTPLVEQLRREGVRVTIGHAAGNVAGADVVVVSSAIDRHNPEYAAAQRAVIDIQHEDFGCALESQKIVAARAVEHEGERIAGRIGPGLDVSQAVEGEFAVRLVVLGAYARRNREGEAQRDRRDYGEFPVFHAPA